MQVTGIRNYQVQPSKLQFRGSRDKELDHGDYIERHIQTEATSSKKWGVGIASFLMPGLGQFINGDVGKGFGFLSGVFGVVGLTFLAFRAKSIGAYCLSIASNLGLKVWSTIDALKNVKSEQVQIIKKSDEQED